MIDEDLARSLKVIKEGEFNELVGAPTLKLIGNLQAANSDDLKVFKEVLTKDNITEGDIISDFATHRNVRNPKAYIRQVCHLQARWLPIYYFASLAGLSLAQLEQEFSASQSPYPRAIEWQINRVKGNRFPPHQGNQPALGPILSLLAEQKMPPLENINDARRALKSLRVMVRKGLDHEFAIKVLASVVAGFLGEQEIRDQLRYASSLLDVAIYRNRIET